MHKVRVDSNGALRCRKCGSQALLAKSSERAKRTQHLKCEQCGERQRYRESKLTMARASSNGATPAAANEVTPVPEPRTDHRRSGTDAGTQTLTRITWRRPDS